MQTSIFIAKLIGPILLVVGFAVVINEKTFRAIAKEVLGSPALIYLFGVIDLALGLVLVLVHNLWVADWRVIITLIGWISIVRGVVRIAFAPNIKKTGAKLIRREGLFMGAAIVALILGAVLSFYGFRV